MSLYGTMRTGVSGMNAQANRLSTVADNIANSSTVGYKKASTQFSSMILPSGNGSYNSGGVNTTVRYSISDQGAFTYTTSATDLAINGEGFFIVGGADGSNYLTRAGNFEVQPDGSLTNAAGFTLMGYPYSSTTDPTIVINGFDGLEEVNVQAGGMNSTPSKAGVVTGNLPSGETAGTYTKSSSLVAYDSQGNSRLLDLAFSKTADNEWSLAVSYKDDAGTVHPLGSYALEFDAAGKLVVPAGGTISTAGLTIAGAELSPLDIDLSDMSQLGSPYSVEGNIDGRAASAVDTVEISKDGIVSILYKNGQSMPAYRIAMANVQSPNNLTPREGNVYSQSNDSGVIVMGYAGNSGYGSILSKALEDSNVDIAGELTSMIESQRNYTANSKVFQTGSELLETLVNLKR
ncbi:flagellar hook-basal body complex protein [Rhizobiales bacterium RZME27]|jgi:flagellar hook protein FlgE|uniref:Flagellar hook protein FlgE n=1 Tax=Endobacterium cereale TaxID=2663029 RepID=A0A6A8AA26_9HYPH|nr:flagellar hook protein FlgE [Endobacterium cereale]MEB2848430.1 flagellar hook protein FlgE [Endobacterium cereale]MQY48082.1 flagellar hook-basal body complex protein [Endobacterium cereale]